MSPAIRQAPTRSRCSRFQLPDCTVTDVQGHTLSSSDLHGKAVLVDF